MSSKQIVIFNVCVGIIILFTACTDNTESVPYTNPVFEPVFADPTVIRAEDGTFYAYGTEDVWAAGESPRFVPILQSDDLVNWEYIGEAFETSPSWKHGAIWAPDVHYFNGQYYLYYTKAEWGNPDVGIGLAVSDTPEGPFTDEGNIFTRDEVGLDVIDPQLFIDDGTPYLITGGLGDGIYGVPLNADGTALAGDFFQLVTSGVEAPYLIERNGYYYLFGSPGSCCAGEDSTYRVIMGRAEALEGPYYDMEGNALLDHHVFATILHGMREEENGKQFVGPGHLSIITDDVGDDWMFYHAVDVEQPYLDNGATRRPMMMDKIIWENDWPHIENNVPSTDEQQGPQLTH